MKKAILDLRVLKKYARKYGLTIDKKHKYILSGETLYVERELRKDNLFIVCFSGCFYPFLCYEV